MGAVSAEEFCGVTEAVTVPDVPGVRESVAGATETAKPGVVLSCAVTLADDETDELCVALPI